MFKFALSHDPEYECAALDSFRETGNGTERYLRSLATSKKIFRFSLF